jgi:hypothetical protein
MRFISLLIFIVSFQVIYLPTHEAAHHSHSQNESEDCGLCFANHMLPYVLNTSSLAVVAIVFAEPFKPTQFAIPTERFPLSFDARGPPQA